MSKTAGPHWLSIKIWLRPNHTSQVCSEVFQTVVQDLDGVKMICKTDELFLHYDLPSAMPPSANVLDDLRFDLALGQIKLGPPLGQSQFITYLA